MGLRLCLWWGGDAWFNMLQLSHAVWTEIRFLTSYFFFTKLYIYFENYSVFLNIPEYLRMLFPRKVVLFQH